MLNVIAWPAAVRREGSHDAAAGGCVERCHAAGAATVLAALQLVLRLAVHTAGWQAGWLVLHSAVTDPRPSCS